MTFEIVSNISVITADGPILQDSTAVTRHRNFHGDIKIFKQCKDGDWMDVSSGP